MYRRAVNEALGIAVVTVIVPLVLPLFMLTIFSRVFSLVTSIPSFPGTTGYVTYLAPAVIVMATMLGAPGAAVSTAVELQTGFFDRMRLAPLGAGISTTARRLADATRLAFFSVVLTIAAWIDGVPINHWPLALTVAMVLGTSWGIAYGGLTLAACLRTASAETAQAMVPLFFPILFMSTGFVPMALLPHWLQSIARYNPVSYICDAIRQANAGHLAGGPLWKAALGILVVGVATQALIRVAIRRLAES
jgi:ABC-2 type transport system permease protein